MTWESQRKYFNPRSHEGSDMIVCCCPSSREVFQSSLPRGERRVRVTYCTSCGNISILAPTRGATNSEAGNNRGIRFQSSLPRGERLPSSHEWQQDDDFNPRSHEGSDSNFRQKVLFSLSKNCLKYLILTTNYFN